MVDIVPFTMLTSFWFSCSECLLLKNQTILNCSNSNSNIFKVSENYKINDCFQYLKWK